MVAPSSTSALVHINRGMHCSVVPSCKLALLSSRPPRGWHHVALNVSRKCIPPVVPRSFSAG
jgi:hypothetical protein